MPPRWRVVPRFGLFVAHPYCTAAAPRDRDSKAMSARHSTGGVQQHQQRPRVRSHQNQHQRQHQRPAAAMQTSFNNGMSGAVFESRYPQPAIREDDENEAETDDSLMSVSDAGGDVMGPPGVPLHQPAVAAPGAFERSALRAQCSLAVVFHARGGGSKRSAPSAKNHGSKKSQKSHSSSSSRRQKFVDEVPAEEAATAKSTRPGGRVTRQKQRELDILRTQHEEMVATMQGMLTRCSD
jgi:hypothetical protein